jgi:hypothetical protein
MKNLRNNKTARLFIIGILILLVIFLYFRNVDLSKVNSVDGATQELQANYKPDTWDKKLLLGAGAVLGAAFGLEASENDWDVKKLYETGGDFKASRVLRDKEGNILTDADLAAGKQGKYTDEYDCKDFSTHPVEGTSLLTRQAVKSFTSSNLAVSAKIENRNQKPKWGRREAPTQMHSPQKFPNPKGFSTLRVAQKVRFDP